MEDPQSPSPLSPASTPSDIPVVKAPRTRKTPDQATPLPAPAQTPHSPTPSADTEQRIVFRKPMPKPETNLTNSATAAERKPAIAAPKPEAVSKKPAVKLNSASPKASSSTPARKNATVQRRVGDSQQKVPRPQPHIPAQPASPHHLMNDGGKTDVLPYVVIGAIVLILGYLFFFAGGSPSATKVTDGMTILVHYVGSFPNGTVFDTSREAVAQEAGIYASGRPYEPLEVKVGSGGVIQGFDAALVGMNVGQSKKITIPPEEAYGLYNPNNTQIVPRVTRINRTLSLDRATTLSVEQFEAIFSAKPELEKSYSDDELPWSFTVSSLDAANVTVQMKVAKGESYQIPDTPWPSVVTVANDSVVVLRHNPVNTSIATPLGPGTIKINSQELLVTITPEVGSSISTVFGPLRVKSVTPESIVLDQNHPLAGETLVFDLEIVSAS